MAGISLYRKWRPQRFEDVIGQKRVTETLTNALSGERLVHAYLFTGPRGTGKTSTARILAKAINCEKGPTATPCNSCEACVSISEGAALDVEEIDAASNRKIDEIRGLLEKIPYLPTSMRSKVYIIDEVHQLTPEASSALLKTLEEPPGHIVFVLATTEPHKLLPTIVSRCQRFDFALVETEEIAGLLQGIAKSEKIDISAEAVSMIAEQSQGSVRDAIGVFDQMANIADEKISAEQVAELLGEVEPEMVFEMIDIIADRDTPGALAMVGRMMESGKDPRRFVEALISQLRNLFLIQNAGNADEIVRATSGHFKRLERQADKIRKPDILKLIERLGDVHREMRWSENPRLELECALVKSLRLETDISVEGLIFRVEELEEKIRRLGADKASGVSSQNGARSTKKRVEEDASGLHPGAETASPPAKPDGRVVEKAGAEPRDEKKKADAKAVEIQKEAKVETESPEAAGKQSGSELDKSKAKRAWMALLSDLKNKGEMRLYSLLTKAKVEDFKNGKLLLAFPHEASFQAAAFEKDDNIAKVEEAWRALVGEPVSIEVVAGENKRRRAKHSDHSETKEIKRQENEEKKRSADTAPEGKQKRAEEDKSADTDPGSIARLLKDSFDGEIMELEDEGIE